MKSTVAERRDNRLSTLKMLKETDGQIDSDTGRRVVKIFSGGWHISSGGEEMLATILGSCVSCCIRDPLIGIGGMNHFLLPGDGGSGGLADSSARYGVHAMECLINGLLQRGASKQRLEVKVFGGGNVTQNSARIGSKNAAFVKEFLRVEGFAIVAQDLEGDLPRRLHYFPDSGRVMLRKLRRTEDFMITQVETEYAATLAQQPIAGDVELFG